MDCRRDYKLALSVVTEVINAWDPYGLLALGAPNDEFESEIASVVSQVPRVKSKRDATLAISRVFSSAFDRETFNSERCAEVGDKLYAALEKNGLIEQAD